MRIPADLTIGGAVLSDQLKSLDLRARNAKQIGRLPDDAFEETVAKILCLIDLGASAR